jgi:putative drug exporter of the RND superfamily
VQQRRRSHAFCGVPATGAITFWVPLMVFASLFGPSTGDDVFILARAREYDRRGSTYSAVVGGDGRTGTLAASAVLILLLAFGALATRPESGDEVAATRVGRGILLGAALACALLLPFARLGAWNWWLAGLVAPVARIHAVAVSYKPAAAAERAGAAA